MKETTPTFELRKPFKVSGQWWLPTRSDDKVAGELSFTHEEGLKLKLLGSLHDPDDGLPTREIINGQSSDAVDMTLIDSFCTLQNRPIVMTASGHNAAVTETYHVGMLLHGINIESKKALVLSKICFEYPLLFEWLGSKPFDVTFDGEMDKATIVFDRSEVFSIDVGDGLTIRVPSGGAWRRDGFRRFVAEERYNVFVQSSTDRAMKDILRVGAVMQNFLSLGTSAPVYPSKVTIHNKAEDGEPDAKIDLFYQLPRWAGHTIHVEPHEMLFTRRSLGDDIGPVIRSWFKLSSELKMVHQALFSNVFNPNQYPENEFLNLVQGLESYHRTRMNNSVEPEEAYIGRKGRIRTALCPSLNDDWKWLEGRLDHANEPSLSVRLTELMYTFREFIPFIDDEKALWIIRSVVRARNRMMHPEEGRPISLTGAQLVMINRILKLFTESILLFEMGIKQSKIASMIERTRDYRNAEFLSRSHIPKKVPPKEPTLLRNT